MTLTAQQVERRSRMLGQFEAWLTVPMIVLSLVWLLLIIHELVWGSSQFLQWLNLAIWCVFIVEFLIRIAIAPEKLSFLRNNWLGLLAIAAPAVRLLTIFKLLPLTRSLALVRVVAAANGATNVIRRTLSRRGLGYALASTIVVLFLGAAGEYHFESRAGAEGGFNSFADSLWWTAMILTTMGSGAWPQTVEGRILCVMLAVYGFVMFGYITANIAAYFLGDKAGPTSADTQALADLRAEIAQLRADLAHAKSGDHPRREDEPR
jgi:voltage-gated potassium channel